MSDRKHSPLGASSAERWMNCHGSNVLLEALKLPESDEEDWRKEGIAAHEAAAHCLQNNQDTWEIVGQEFHGYKITSEDANHIQVYLDSCRADMTSSATVMIERRIGDEAAKRPHRHFYGTVDFAAYDTDRLTVADFKYGEGIVVEPEWNVQAMYYALGILLLRPHVRDDREVLIRIVQPRAWHESGSIREWLTSAGEIKHWGETELLPAMQAAEVDKTFDNGPWCRFCPAKLLCPLLTSLYGAAMKADANALPNFSADRLALEWKMRDQVKMYLRALEQEVYRRNSIGHTVPGTKLVYQKVNRVFVPEAKERLEKEIGPEIFTTPELKSPAQVEKISEKAKKLVHELAFMPKAGLTVAAEDDSKPGVKVDKIEDVYAHLTGASHKEE